MEHTNFEQAFRDGARFELSDGTAIVHPRQIAELVVTSGEIVACDPLTMPDTPAFTTRVPPGRYPVVLSIAHLADGDQRVACAKVDFSAHPVARWEPALVAGQDPSRLGPEEFFGYGVDSGTSAFLDAEAARALSGWDFDRTTQLIEQLDRNQVLTWNWLDIPITDSGANLVAFGSGFGDGAYASYLGYDASDTLGCLVTDFDLLRFG
jgi:hypothetical protein